MGIEIVERRNGGLFAVGAHLDEIGFAEETVSVVYAFPAELVFEEEPHAPHASALDGALDDKAASLEEVAVSVIAQAIVPAVAEFYRAFSDRDSLRGIKLCAACLFYEPLHFRDGIEHVLVVLCGILDRVFGYIVPREHKLFDAVSLVVRCVELRRGARLDRVRIPAHGEVKSGLGLSRDGHTAAFGAQYVSVVFKIHHVDAAGGIASERKIDAVGKLVSEAVRKPYRIIFRVR